MLKVHPKRSGDLVVLCLEGEIVTGETSSLREEVLAQLGVSTVVLDFARVSGIDAGGLGVLLELREQTASRRIEFKLVNIPAMVRQVLETTGLDSVFDISSAENVVVVRGRAGAALQLPACT